MLLTEEQVSNLMQKKNTDNTITNEWLRMTQDTIKTSQRYGSIK